MTLQQSVSSIDDVRLHYVSTFEEIEGFWRWLGERHENDTLAIDIETTGLDHTAKDAAIRLIQFGDMRQGWAIPAQDWPGLCREALQRWDGQFAGHNAVAFDGRWLRKFLGWEFPRHRTVDTMIAAAIIDPISPVGLKPLSDRLIDPRASFGQDLLHRGMSDNGWTWATVPLTFEPYSTYSSMDVVLTAQVWDKFKFYVDPGKAYADVMELEMNTRFIASAMEDRGMRIDVDYCSAQFTRLQEFDREMAAWAKEAYGISLSANAAVAQKLVELGAPLLERTNGGALKVDKDVLTFMSNSANGIPEGARMLAEQVLRTRNARKIASTYFAAVLERVQDGIIHPEIRTMGARTGRMSISNPALQQLPKKDGYVRNAFIPRHEGELLLSCDYSQIELRMMGNFSQDEGLSSAFRDADATGGDFFVNLGRDVYEEPDFAKSDSRRGLLKNTMYGRIYGASTGKMAATAGVPVDRMAGVVSALDTTYPGIKAFMKEIEAVGKERERYEGQGYVMTPSGRRLPCDRDRVYTLTNYCFAPDTPVLRSDLVHVPAIDLKVGDRLVAFDEFPVTNEQATSSGRSYSIRRWRTAEVEAVSRVVKPTLQITLSDGRVLTCSNDHLWLYQHKKDQPRTRWVRADKLYVGQDLHSVGIPWEVDSSRDGGWLAGMYDGEGCLTSRNSGGATTTLTFSQLAGPVMTKFRQAMEERDLPYRYQIAPAKSTSPTDSCLTTSVPGIMRVLGTLQPERFKPRFESMYEGGALVGGSTELVQVVGIEDVGLRELASIQTSTRTLIANGVLSHNCIQSSAADVLKRAMVRLDASEWGEHMLLPVHDEVVFSIPEEEIPRALREIPEIMGEHDHPIPLKAEAEGGFDRWGEKYA